MSSSEIPRPGGADFQDVYRAFRPRILRYLQRLIGPGEAEDLTQEVFAKLSRALPRFRGDASLSTWVYRIATNTAYDRLRSPSFHRTGEMPLQNEMPAKDEFSGVEQVLVRRQMNACIEKYIQRLPPSYRAVVILSEHEGLTNQQIVDTLHVSLDTVKIRLHRARARLRRELGSGCSFYRDERNEFACEPK